MTRRRHTEQSASEASNLDGRATDDAARTPDLGDFSTVWRFLDRSRRGVSVVDESVIQSAEDGEEIPASRKQLVRKSVEVKDPVVISPAKKEKSKKSVAVKSRTSESGELVWEDIIPPPATTVPRRSKAKVRLETEDDSSSGEYSSFEDTFPLRRNSFPSSHRLKFSHIPPAPPSTASRRRTLIEKLISKFPAEESRILNQLPGKSQKKLHIFVDNSNILIGFYETYKSKHNVQTLVLRTKFDFHTFTSILERGRPVAQKCLVGSNPLVQPVAMAQTLGYQVSILEPVVDSRMNIRPAYSSDSATRTPAREKKREQAVDEILHLKILECILDVTEPGIIVLATGDAAPAEFSPEGGFLKCIQRALKRGWDVELVCWRKSMSRLWREKAFRSEFGSRFKVIQLDDFVDELVLD
jgi:hypothetical protein